MALYCVDRLLGNICCLTAPLNCLMHLLSLLLQVALHSLSCRIARNHVVCVMRNVEPSNTFWVRFAIFCAIYSSQKLLSVGHATLDLTAVISVPLLLPSSPSMTFVSLVYIEILVGKPRGICS